MRGREGREKENGTKKTGQGRTNYPVAEERERDRGPQANGYQRHCHRPGRKERKEKEEGKIKIERREGRKRREKQKSKEEKGERGGEKNTKMKQDQEKQSRAQNTLLNTRFPVASRRP